MKKHLLLLIISALTLHVGHSQTNVSGGIYSNTTWTLANSPYIVTDTIVVFPGVTLTIQPGVTVKFANNKRLEIRQAKLIAIGTLTDSITFTSNFSSPTHGIYAGIDLNGGNFTSKFNYCNFYYANQGIGHYLVNDTLIVKNSNFRYNNYGIKDNGLSNDYSFIDSCNFTYNNVDGLFVYGEVRYCNISYNNGNGIEGGGNGGLIKNCIVTFNNLTGTFGSEIINCNISHNGCGVYAPERIKNSIINYNDTAIFWGQIIDSSIVRHNNYAIIGGQNIGNVIKNSFVDSNSVMGVSINGTFPDSVIYCQIKYNGIGLDINSQSSITKNIIENNSIGIRLKNTQSNIHCNGICNNTTYNLKYTLTTNTDVSNNYWCTSDSASIVALIYDGYDNLSLGLVNFMPLDISCSPINQTTFVNEISNISFSIFPNPFSTKTTLKTDKVLKDATFTVYNSYGLQIKQIKNISGQTITLHRDNLPSGLYFVHLTQDNKVIATKKLIITD